MDEVFKTHKETTFGWLLAVQQLIAAFRARRARRRATGTTVAKAASVRRPMRYLTPR